tara:strand:+ start:771 stop:2807 length:2037 start_codon:yes stop_codon:yes gene_type:complete
MSDNPGGGFLRAVSNSQLDQQEQAALAAQKASEVRLEQEESIAAHIRTKFQRYRDTRQSEGIADRLLESLRAFRGEYSPEKKAEIKKFGGSTVYSRLSALKCRGATAMLRDIYLAGERPWFVEATPKPTLPEDITKSMLSLVGNEVRNAQQGGQQVEQKQIQERVKQLAHAAEKAAVGKAKKEAEAATDFLDDILVEGGFYDALVDFLHHLTVFPYAFVKGPVVRMATDVKWENGRAVTKDIPKMYWTAPNPFDIYWQSGARKFEHGDVIEHIRLTRAELNNLIGVPGYNEEHIRAALQDYGNGGLADWLDYTDSERADLESREDPHSNDSDMIDTLEFHGKIQGSMLLEYGFTEEEVTDPDMDYFCTAWLIQKHVIKVQIDPSPRKRHPYYMTSFEKIPGAIVGYGLPEILDDIQDVANASLRALVNNLSIASGPQVVVNDDRISPNNDSDELYPWKRWHVINDPLGSAEPAVNFHQPQSNSQELLATYQQMTTIADEISSIPRYMTGSSSVGGAGRTASGLNMLMQNAGKVLQSVAANIDADIFAPLLQKLYDTVLLTDEEGRLQGDESIRVRGVVFANQRENERTRMLEFLQMTANPIDSQIVGMEGRAELLREIADRIGLEGVQIVPDKETVKQQQAQQAQAPQGATPGGKPPPEAGAVDEGLKGAARGPSGQA